MLIQDMPNCVNKKKYFALNPIRFVMYVISRHPACHNKSKPYAFIPCLALFTNNELIICRKVMHSAFLLSAAPVSCVLIMHCYFLILSVFIIENCISEHVRINFKSGEKTFLTEADFLRQNCTKYILHTLGGHWLCTSCIILLVNELPMKESVAERFDMHLMSYTLYTTLNFNCFKLEAQMLF